MATNTYDNIVWLYDRLSRMVYGRTLISAQLWLLSAIPAGAKILIVGGGTGEVLEEITKLRPSGLDITYVDASEKMIARAKTRNAGNNRVTFIASRLEDAGLCDTYDIALTPFFFDNFTGDAAEDILCNIDALLHPQSKWLYCDFQDAGKVWQSILLRVMYTFFKVTVRIGTNRLPHMEHYFSKHRYTVAKRATFFKNFVVSIVYEKSAT
jgi:ubiquinone/menaquinone biosynthesis C-methylase UbiE